MVEINRGISRLVKMLNKENFPTTDSGDGQTREFSHDRPTAYVVVSVENPAELSVELDLMVAFLARNGVEVVPCGADGAEELPPDQALVEAGIMLVPDQDGNMIQFAFIDIQLSRQNKLVDNIV